MTCSVTIGPVIVVTEDINALTIISKGKRKRDSVECPSKTMERQKQSIRVTFSPSVSSINYFINPNIP